jgi:23S rRNA maturation mini-RNase III
MLDDEPKGWRQLQERAQREKDPKKLAEIIDEMNQLLTEHEKAAAKEEKPSPRSERKPPKR